MWLAYTEGMNNTWLPNLLDNQILLVFVVVLLSSYHHSAVLKYPEQWVNYNPLKKKKTILWHWSRSYILAYCKCHEFSKLKYSNPKDAFSAHAQKDWMLENDYCTEDKNETKVNKLIWFKLDECKWLKLVDICCSKKNKQTWKIISFERLVLEIAFAFTPLLTHR